MPENASDPSDEAPADPPVVIRFGALPDLQFDDEHFDDEDPEILAMFALA